MGHHTLLECFYSVFSAAEYSDRLKLFFLWDSTDGDRVLSSYFMAVKAVTVTHPLLSPEALGMELLDQSTDVSRMGWHMPIT